VRAPIDNQQVAQECSKSAAEFTARAAEITPKPRRLKSLDEAENSLSFEEIDAAHEEWGCNCGPSALAAILGLKPADVRHHIPDFDKRRYTNPSMMERALRSLGVEFSNVDDADDRREGILSLPRYGLVRVQWTGPWMLRSDRFGVMDQYRHTHWIATAQFFEPKEGVMPDGPQCVFDVNYGWRMLHWWNEQGGPQLAASVATKGDGRFTFTHRWEVEL
jgi:hypothetical protein